MAWSTSTAWDQWDPEKLLTCPYDPVHLIMAKRFQNHLVKCRKNHPEKDFVTCPFNASHVMLRPNLRHHISQCKFRNVVDADVALDKEKNESGYYFKGNTSVPSYRTNLPEPDEDWDEEGEENQSVLNETEDSSFYKQCLQASKSLTTEDRSNVKLMMKRNALTRNDSSTGCAYGGDNSSFYSTERNFESDSCSSNSFVERSQTNNGSFHTKENSHCNGIKGTSSQAFKSPFLASAERSISNSGRQEHQNNLPSQSGLGLLGKEFLPKKQMTPESINDYHPMYGGAGTENVSMPKQNGNLVKGLRDVNVPPATRFSRNGEHCSSQQKSNSTYNNSPSQTSRLNTNLGQSASHGSGVHPLCYNKSVGRGVGLLKASRIDNGISSMRYHLPMSRMPTSTGRGKIFNDSN